jgi:hypothetical protein
MSEGQNHSTGNDKVNMLCPDDSLTTRRYLRGGNCRVVVPLEFMPSWCSRFRCSFFVGAYARVVIAVQLFVIGIVAHHILTERGSSCCQPDLAKVRINRRHQVFRSVRTIDSTPHSSHEIIPDARQKLVLLQGLLQVRYGQAERVREFEQKRQTQAFLVLVEAVVHLPEASVRAGEFASLGSTFGIGIDLRHGEITKHESELVTKAALHSFNDVVSQATVRTLIVSVL